MNGVMRKSAQDDEALRIIRKCGFICREANGIPWVTTGEPITPKRFNRLLEMGLLQPQGDSLFGGPSQTYIPTKDEHVSGNPASPPAVDSG